MGLFAAGCAPTGNSDPYALRRAAVGLLSILLQQGVHMDLPALVALASAQLPVPVTPEVRAGVLDFITRWGAAQGGEGVGTRAVPVGRAIERIRGGRFDAWAAHLRVGVQLTAPGESGPVGPAVPRVMRWFHSTRSSTPPPPTKTP